MSTAAKEIPSRNVNVGSSANQNNTPDNSVPGPSTPKPSRSTVTGKDANSQRQALEHAKRVSKSFAEKEKLKKLESIASNSPPPTDSMEVDVNSGDTEDDEPVTSEPQYSEHPSSSHVVVPLSFFDRYGYPQIGHRGSKHKRPRDPESNDETSSNRNSKKARGEDTSKSIADGLGDTLVSHGKDVFVNVFRMALGTGLASLLYCIANSAQQGITQHMNGTNRAESQKQVEEAFVLKTHSQSLMR